MRFTVLLICGVFVGVCVCRPQQHPPVTDIGAAYQAYHQLWLSEARRNSVAPTALHSRTIFHRPSAPVPDTQVQQQVVVEEPLVKEVLAEPKVVQEQTEAEQPVQEQLAAEQPIQEQLAAEQPIQEQLAAEPVQEQLAAEPVQEQLATEQPIQEQLEAEQPIQEQLAAEQPIQEQLAAEQPIQEQLAAEPVQEQLAVEPVQEQLAVAVEEPVQEQLVEVVQAPEPTLTVAAEPEPQQLAAEPKPAEVVTPVPDMAAAFNNFFELWHAEAARNAIAPKATRFVNPLAPVVVEPQPQPAVEVVPEPQPHPEPQPILKTVTPSAPQQVVTVPSTNWLSPSFSWGQQGQLPFIIVLPQYSGGAPPQRPA